LEENHNSVLGIRELAPNSLCIQNEELTLVQCFSTVPAPVMSTIVLFLTARFISLQ
jgi:hypothetical protein